MAEAVARRSISRRGWTTVEARSAGVSTVRGGPASDGALRAAGRHGLDLGAHRSQPLSPELIAWADLILAMTPGHLARLLEAGAGHKAQLLTEFAAGREASGVPASVPDPFGGSDREYEETFTLLQELVEAAIQRLAPQIAP